MRECTFISKLIFALCLLSTSAVAQVADPAAVPIDPTTGSATTPQPAIPSGKREESTLFDQYSPYLDYGDFNSSDEEDADTLYFQYGRFFGVSLGLGYETATGNRGLVYNAAFPRFDFKIHYWFDFNWAMSMGIWFASHDFDEDNTVTTAKLIGYYVDLKYYFDVRDASAALSFSNPYLLLGVGAISKTESSGNTIEGGTDSSLSMSFGTGLEFPISYKKTYFLVDLRYWTQSFQDTNSSDFQESRGAADLSGGFFTVMAHLMFTW